MSEPKDAAARLAALRAEIDALDDAWLEVIGRRAEVARSVAEAKAALGRADDYDAAREREVIERLVERGAGLLPAAAVRAVAREVIAGCRAVQRPASIAFLGPEGTFTHEAARRAFGDAATLIALPTIAAVLGAVERGEALRGVVPIENSTEGGVLETLRLLFRSPLRIEREVLVPIEHHLMSVSGRLDDVRRVVSHPQALGQCAEWLRATLPDVALVPASSTAAAARECVSDPSSAAIGASSAAEVFGLRLAASSIQDRRDNTTRFVCVGMGTTSPSGRDRTTVLFALVDGAGALRRALGAFEDHGQNLTRIESLPDRERAWRHLFAIDVDGHADDPAVREALDALRAQVAEMRVVGSYGRASE